MLVGVVRVCGLVGEPENDSPHSTLSELFHGAEVQTVSICEQLAIMGCGDAESDGNIPETTPYPKSS